MKKTNSGLQKSYGEKVNAAETQSGDSHERCVLI